MFPSSIRATLTALITPIAFVACGGCSVVGAADLSALVATITAEVRSDQAMRYMRDVYSSDRYFTFPAFQNTAGYLERTASAIGLERVELVRAPADGTTQVGYWTMPIAWDAKSATLEILNNNVPQDSRMLVDYERVPASLGMWSGPTAPDGVRAEIVAVSSADLQFPEKLDLRDKLALMDVNPAGYKWLLVKAGALGAINTFTENPKLEDGRQWINAWGDAGWAYTKSSTPLLSFSITPRQSAMLRKLLASERVYARAKVNTRFYEGSYPYVTAVLRGTGPEEVLTLAHTAELGAHDNATGVAATMEALGALNRLIDQKKLQRPRRSIRILLMGEMYGSMHYVASNPEGIRRTVAALCVDTPAAAYEMAGTEYSFHMNPHVAKDFTDAFILKVASTYFPTVGRPWHEKEFATGTDTYMAEPMVGVPTVWSYSGSGVETHHNSEDTPDRVDPRSLKDLTTVAASFLYFIANANSDDAVWLASLSETRGYQQILKRTGLMLEGAASRWDASDGIAYAVDRESQSVRSVLRLVPEGERHGLQVRLDPMLKRLARFGEQQRERLPAATGSGRQSRVNDREAARIVVRRKRFGTIPLDDLPKDQWERQPSGAWAATPTIALYWCDGRRNLAEVARLTEHELGPTKFDFVAYFRFLRKHGYVEFVKE